MVPPPKKKKVFNKIVDESFHISKRKGGGRVKIEIWEDGNGDVVKYGIAYVNPLICPADNGRVIGYDNSHGFHHKHYMGRVIEIEPFKSYKELIRHFEDEIKEFIKR